jgi:hypothetical protein
VLLKKSRKSVKSTLFRRIRSLTAEKTTLEKIRKKLASKMGSTDFNNLAMQQLQVFDWHRARMLRHVLLLLSSLSTLELTMETT